MLGIDVLVLDGASASAVGTTIDVVSAANRILGEPAFDLRFVASESRVVLRGGLVAAAQPLARARPRDVIVTPGLGAAEPQEIADRLDAADVAAACRWLTRANAGGADIAASCTAVFVLAAAGLLDERRCVTTWWLGADLTRVAPAARVVIDEMVVRDGPIWTAGSAFAHIDLMLALMRHLGGAALTDELANRLVADQRTSQASFLIPSHLAARDATVADLESFVRSRLDQPHTLDSLARRSGLSPRTLARRTGKAVGLSPLQLVQRVRLERSLHLLRTTRMPLEQIACAVGLADAAALHRLVKRHTGRSPGALRPGVAVKAS
ncbi:GlxA family transcriptional regulator [Mycolicibacterium moriokaense]|uniref:AraC family transcriptional regulator with amidase-like domain n=1 Tax=Mycolicibacterium moriokaense TaxID=39691 RepID=A0A318HG16_9MYCO|nr:helix-turn-helix domain-containing protein [Mycolicibacterium moriokaense]PXX08153.1 AraC family transcriptional regulator with amidase-like domain [Mycolicibacterium moriokaense]